MEISGKTKICALLGWPVEHSISPAMHNAAFRTLGLDYCYVTFPVRPDMLREAVSAIRALNLAGVNVTVPHKENVMAHLDEIDEEAAFIGAVNTVVNKEGRLKGYNTDGRGFMRGLIDDGVEVGGKRVLLIGAGGAARAIGYYLSEKAELSLYDIDRGKAERLAGDLNKIGRGVKCPDGVGDLKGFDMVINATPLGLKPGDPLPCDPALLRADQTVGELIYKETPFIKEAAKRGCRTFDGLGMLLWQGVIAFELWTGKKPPQEVMRAALRGNIK